MIQITQESKEAVQQAVREGRIDAAEISQPNFIDGIILKMQEMGVVDAMSHHGCGSICRGLDIRCGIRIGIWKRD